MSFFSELRRRKVFRVAAVYAVVGWLIIQVANATFADFGIPVWANRLVVLMVMLGFPIALVLTWAFELTPEGITMTRTARGRQANLPAPPEHHKKRNWLAYLVGAAIPTLIFGVASTIFYFTARESADYARPAPTSVGKSIAVLPFENLSNLDGDVGFTNGIHGDLLTQLSGIRDIRTIQRASVMAYLDTDKNYKTIGEELRVANILEGGVQRAGNKVRIKVTLFDASTDDVLFLETYTRELTAENVFEIQAEISLAIAEALQAQLSPEEQEQIEKLPTHSLAALEAYHRGVENYDEQTASGVEKGIEHFKEAISLDPDFAKAHAMLGRLLLMQTSRGGLPKDLQIEKAEPHILRALELDDNECESYSALAYLRRKQGDYDEAELAYKKALELNPNNAVALKTYATFLTGFRPDLPKAVRILRRAYEIDPKNEQAPGRLALSLELSGQLDEAQELRESTATENPEDAKAQLSLGRFYLNYLGRFDDAIVAYRKTHFLDPKNTYAPSGVFFTYLSLGDSGKTLWWGERYLRIQQNLGSRMDFRSRMLKIEGNDAAREELALEGLKENPKHAGLLYYLADLDIASGHPERSRSKWELAYPSLFEPSAEIDGNNAWKARDLARVLTATGEREQANYLITEALTAAKSMHPDYYNLRLEAELHAISGDERKTLAAIRRYFEAGGSPYFLMIRDVLKPFQDNPEYQEMAAEPEARMAAQLKRIREMEANGELAPIPELPAD